MNDTETGQSTTSASRRILSRTLIVAVCICTLGLISLGIYLQTPYPASLLSTTLTSYLQQPLRITGLHATGGSIYLTGVSLGNPPDVPCGNLIQADSIIITPNWGALLTGRRSLRLIALEGLKLNLLKNSAGVWNFSQLQRRLNEKKSAGTELLIEQFIVKAGVIQVNGQGAQGISLHLFHLATKGSSNAQLKLSFEDPARNIYTVSGTTRLGANPAFDLVLAAPSLSLSRLAGLLDPGNRFLPEGGNGSLRVTAVLQDGRVRASGRLDFSRVSMPSPPVTPPLTGSITATAAYTIKTDEVSLETLTVMAGNLMRGHAAGTIGRLNGERHFAGTFGIDELNLAALTYLLPHEERRKTTLNGTLHSTEFRISGNSSQGLVSANGQVMLKNVSLERGGQRLFKGLTSTAAITGEPDGFLVKGSLSQGEAHGGALLESLQAPFEITLSRRLKPGSAAIPALRATIMGLAVTGRLAYNAHLRDPFLIDLRIPAVTVSSLRFLPENLHLQIASGSGSLALKGTGRGPQDFSATANVRVATVRGTRDGTTFGIKKGEVDSRIARDNGKLDLRGKARFSGLSLDDRAGDARFLYRIAGGTVLLDNVTFHLDGASASIAHLTASIPQKASIAGTVRYPLVFEVAGAGFRRGRAELDGLSGSMRGGYLSDPGGKWLEGTADVSSARVVWQGQMLAAPAVHVAFSRAGGLGTISGRLLGGLLTGEIGFQPLDLREAGTFRFGIRSGQLSSLGKLLPRPGAVTLSSGTFDGTARGSYSRRAGLAGRFDVTAADITLTGSGGKTLLGDGGLHLSGNLSGSRLAVDNATLSAGRKVTLQAKGEVANLLSPQRVGNLRFSLPPTSLDSIIDPFANILPRVIQEATVAGSLASEGSLTLRNGRQLLDGSLLLKDVLVELPSQAFRTAAITGHIPFAFDLSGATSVKLQDTSGFTRNNYPGLLKQLRSGADGRPSLTIGSVTFGSLNLGEISLQISAGNGITRIDSLRSSLYDGSLFGTGFVTVNRGINYRTDLLVNGLSLKRFCATIPKIKDYISGRLDGIISIKGEGSRMAGLSGFTDLWVHEGSGEKMLVSKDFLQKLSGKNLSGFFFRSDHPYDNAEVSAVLEDGMLTFNKLDIVNTNMFGVRDLSVSIAPNQNQIALDHLITTIKQAAERGKTGGGGNTPPAAQEFQWQD
ncbi:MAG: hypothetical protein M0T70_04945 [Geobacteraceae bacterium]|nr:hypothetical protein [Geobacteraceae bacterium]